MVSSSSLKMFFKCGLLLLCMNFVRTIEDYENGLINVGDTDSITFSWWPSVHNAAMLLRNRRDLTPEDKVGPSEGGAGDVKVPLHAQPETPAAVASVPPVQSAPKVTEQNKTDASVVKTESEKDQSPKVPGNTTQSTIAPAVISASDAKSNTTTTNKSTSNDIDLNNPGVLKRGIIVFGGFALMAVAYYIFYRRKSNKNDSNNSHSTIDANQFRYDVLQSEDRRSTTELLARVPLTMESDDDEEEDLEIFDLEQKKKSLSYVNLQMNDEDIVLNRSENKEDERDNLLLDIEDGTSETLINWSSSGSKSIL